MEIPDTKWLWLPAAALVAGLLAWTCGTDAIRWGVEVIRSDIHPGVFALMMTVLPMVGFPFSPFLIMAGTKFSFLPALALTTVSIAIHMLAAHALSGSFVRPHLKKLFQNRGYALPELPGNEKKRFSFVFMAVPGLPYAVKNYALPLAGVDLRTFMPPAAPDSWSPACPL